jgi:hypothetical protein
MNNISMPFQNNKNRNWFNEILQGLVVFLVPFFSFLAPVNLKQVSSHLVLQIGVSLLFIFVILVAINYGTSIVISKWWEKKTNGLFCLYCFGFYLLFLYLPVRNFIGNFFFGQNSIIPASGYLAVALLLLFWLTAIYMAYKYSQFVVRLILIYSILMLTTSIVPMLGYFYEESMREKHAPQLEAYQILKNENHNPLNPNIYYIIMDAMLPVESARQMAIIDETQVVPQIEKLGLRYIKESLSSYNGTRLTLTSIFLADYHYREDSERYTSQSTLFPTRLYGISPDVPLLAYLNQASSSLYWVDNYLAHCVGSLNYKCIYSDEFKEVVSSLLLFYEATPLGGLFRKIGGQSNQDAIGRFLNHILEKGLPKTPFFAFVHHLSPHKPHSFTKTCGLAKVQKKGSEGGYSDSYYCALLKIKKFMEVINILDPDAIVVFQADHGWAENDEGRIDMTRGGKIFNAVKAPSSCFEKYGEPKTNVNSIRFVLNCAYGFEMPFRKEIHYQGFHEKHPRYGTVVERPVY